MRSKPPCADTPESSARTKPGGASWPCSTISTTSASPRRTITHFEGCEELERRGYPAWVTRAILSHANYSGVARESRLEKTLFACDEMAGMITAAALVRPSKSILDLEAASVVKRMKDKAFARAVSRDDLRAGAEELGLPLADHVANVIRFMRLEADALGLRGLN